MFLRAILVTCLFGVVLSKEFPDISALNFYSTEVQLTLMQEESTIYVYEYYNSNKKRGAVTLYMEGDFESVYYDNNTNEVLEVNKTHCKATEVDISDYTYTPIFHGWLNKDPLVVGPSAPLRYALKNKDKLQEAGTEVVRDIICDKWELNVQNKIDNFTIEYYFAPADWTTPYVMKKFLTPIRIRIVGTSTRYSDMTAMTNVDQVTDFAFFKEAIEDSNVLQPPIGIGCKLRQKSDDMPSIPDTFKFSAEKVDLKQLKKHNDVEVQFERIWYDYPARLGRVDRYTRKKGYKSAFYDFRGGAAYIRLNDGTCQMSSLRNTELVNYDLGMSGRMKSPAEFLMLEGNFYSMGKREVRGIKCNAYESVLFDLYFMDEHYEKIVVTVYFIENFARVGVEGETESQIPTSILINGWSTPTNNSLSLQYNIYGFDDVAWPPMYSSFGIEKCHVKPESKIYFVVILEVGVDDARTMEGQDQLIISELRSTIAQHAKVPEHRIPFLKADYKTAGVFVSGVILERPPALLQFFRMDNSPTPTITRDPDLKIVEAGTLEECSYACVDEGDFPCKGFYFCNRACFLKSVDPFEDESDEKETDLGMCYEYIRAERESTTFREAYLDEALGYLENAILNGTIKVTFEIPNGNEVVTVKDIVIGDGPYTSTDAGDKPFKMSIGGRKLNRDFSTTQTTFYAETLTDCYKQCKNSGLACSSFSFCPGYNTDDKDCLITSSLVIKDLVKDSELVEDPGCNIYNPKYLDYYDLYPGKLSLLPGDESIRSVSSTEECAEKCRKATAFKCRGFEYCRSMKTCTLHKKHILDLKPGETGSSKDVKCVHYAAKYVADYTNEGVVLISDNSNVRYGLTLDECSKVCSEELGEECKSFNYCVQNVEEFTDSSCALSKKLLRDDGVATTETKGCLHYEKRDAVHDWDTAKAKEFSNSGYTKKGFTGLVIGTLAVGLIAGALGFVIFSYFKSKNSGEGMAVRFMKNET